ncbi:MAG: hypothetical protein ACKO47_04605 [Alphaproteobacteria bacterium]
MKDTNSSSNSDESSSSYESAGIIETYSNASSDHNSSGSNRDNPSATPPNSTSSSQDNQDQSKSTESNSSVTSMLEMLKIQTQDSAESGESVFLPANHQGIPQGILISETSPEDNIEASKTKEIFINCYPEDGKVFLEINSTQRPAVRDLSVGEGQGDHVTCYASFIMAIVNSADQLSIQDTPQILRKIILAILPDAKLDEISETKTHDRDKRKILTASLRYAKENHDKIIERLAKIPEDHPLRILTLETLKISNEPDKFKSDLKDGALSKYCNEIRKLAKFFLVSIQDSDKIAFDSKGRQDKNKSEGADIKKAIQALSAINSLYVLIARLDNKSIKDDEKKQFVTAFTNKLDEKYGDIKLGFNELLKKSIAQTSLDPSALVSPESTANILSNLNKFIDDQSPDNSSGVSQTFDSKKISKYLQAIDDKLVPYANTISDLFFELFDFKRTVKFVRNKEEIVVTRDLKDLYHLSARHLVIMFSAFKEITNYLHKETQTSIIESFLGSVIKKDGWHECEELGGNEKKQLENLKNKVSQILNTDDGYSLKTKSEIDSILQGSEIKEDDKTPNTNPTSNPKNKSARSLKSIQGKSR